MRVKTKVMTTMLEVLAIRVESDCVRQVLRSSRKAGSRVHKSVQCASHSAQCAMHHVQCGVCDEQCALYIVHSGSMQCMVQSAAQCIAVER